mgnify:FL=1
MKKIINYLNETVKKEKNILIFNTIIFLVGVVLGSLFINFITNDDKKLLIEQVSTFFSNVKKLTSDIFGFESFLSILFNNLLVLSIIFVLGISMIGIPIVIFILFFKGFMLGTTISTIILKYSIKGIIGIILYIFPVCILSICVYLFMCFYAIYASKKFLRAFLKKDTLNFKQFLGKYLLSFIVSITLILLLSLLDAYLTPLLLKLFTYLI